VEHIGKVVRERKSVRTFDGKAITPEDRENLLAFLETIENPYGVPLEFRLLDAREQGLSCPVVTGTDLYIGAKGKRVPHINEAFGYSFELLVLYAQSLGIGTVWIGGTMDRKAFERAMALGDDEVMPCVSPLGYPAAKPSLRDSMMRKGIRADHREPFETLFFDRSFETPLTKEKAGALAEPLELVRWAPSAVNRQPWRGVVDERGAHFYLKRARGPVPGALVDMQRIDMGIALAHFSLGAKEQGLQMTFERCEPGVDTDMEYIASYCFAEK